MPPACMRDTQALGSPGTPPGSPGTLSGSSEQVLTFCVGGTMFTTTLGTLTAVPGSYLSILFGGGNWKPSSMLPGSSTPFIDRDGELFRYVLAYLRSIRNQHQQQHILLPDTPGQLQQLKAEADFFGLPGLALACSVGRCGTQHGAAWATAAALQQQQQQVVQQEQEQETVTRQQAQSGGTQDAQVDTADVQLSLCRVSSSRLSLAEAVLQAQHVLAGQQQEWAQDVALQAYADVVLQHMLQLPLSAQQPDLVAALARAESGCKLELRFAYFPVGDTRIDIQCRTLPANADQATAVAAAAAAAAGAGAGAGAAANHTASPGMSPRDVGYSDNAAGDAVRAVSGSLSPEAAGVAAVAAAAAAAAAAVNSYSTGQATLPGPGWANATTYHRFTIKETSADKFVLTTQRPGEPQEVQEVPHTAFRPQLRTLSSLHKLCVQQCPRATVAGLAWLLEQAGFSSVQLSTSLEAYNVGRNTFTGFTSIITCGL